MARTRTLLVLGGTGWLGGAVAGVAMADGWAVTCLARGESGTPPAGVRWVQADRREPTAYHAVAGQEWDAVVEVSWQPEMVRSALDALAPAAAHWTYVSSVSAYADDSQPGMDESAALLPAYTGPE